MVLTVKGKAEAVVQDAEAYQRLLNIAARADVHEAIRQGLEDVARGAGVLDGALCSNNSFRGFGVVYANDDLCTPWAKIRAEARSCVESTGCMDAATALGLDALWPRTIEAILSTFSGFDSWPPRRTAEVAPQAGLKKFSRLRRRSLPEVYGHMRRR